MDATPREKMDRRLRTKDGKALYKIRSVLVEPVFGMIKSARGIERFARRGFAACAQEWKLICATHNLLKLWRDELQTRAAIPGMGLHGKEPMLPFIWKRRREESAAHRFGANHLVAAHADSIAGICRT